LPQKCRKDFSLIQPSGPWAGRGGTAQLSSHLNDNDIYEIYLPDYAAGCCKNAGEHSQAGLSGNCRDSR
jgi:hypothetical protein